MNGVILRWPITLPIGTTINSQYYKKVLQHKLRPAIRKKRPGLLESGILFHHDNAPVHAARPVTDVLAGYKWLRPIYNKTTTKCMQEKKFVHSLRQRYLAIPTAFTFEPRPPDFVTALYLSP
ncbi:mariner Mos1 transposase [Elysia marginata]|uniref:Mariner Mos1 transposase n=1 Tax=Elysia marginata TaxID=1093978 RepID=A0AAV4JFY1_9GAST|nr:mariner Mos1 transposase [Elysia marginata]